MNGWDCTDGQCQCRYCNQVQPCADFTKSSTSPRGHSLRCRQCATTAARLRTGSSPQKYLTAKNCPWCGNTFKTDHDRSKYCSRNCMYAARSKPDASPVYILTCTECAKPFASPRDGKKYCSPDCRTAYSYRRNYLPVQPRPATCIDCQGQYTQTHGHNTRCPNCLRDRNDAIKAQAKAKRRGRELATPNYLPINRRLIYERDNWTCYLCNEPVDRAAPNNHPKQPTLDHVWPLSLGGTHTEDNLRLACRACNTRKSTDFLMPPPPLPPKRKAKATGATTFSGNVQTT